MPRWIDDVPVDLDFTWKPRAEALAGVGYEVGLEHAPKCQRCGWQHRDRHGRCTWCLTQLEPLPMGLS